MRLAFLNTLVKPSFSTALEISTNFANCLLFLLTFLTRMFIERENIQGNCLANKHFNKYLLGKCSSHHSEKGISGFENHTMGTFKLISLMEVKKS